MEKGLVLVDPLLPDLEVSSFLPQICHEVHLVREYVADDGRVDVLPGLEKLVSESPRNLFDFASVLVGDDVGKGLLPAAALLARKARGADLLNDGGEIVLGDGLHDLFDEDVLMKGEVLRLDLLKQFFAAGFGYQKRLGRSSCFQCDSRSPAPLTQEKVLLDDAFCTLIPVGVP